MIGATTEGVDMADEQAPPAGPDLTQGIAFSDFTGETLLGHVGEFHPPDPSQAPEVVLGVGPEAVQDRTARAVEAGMKPFEVLDLGPSQ